MMMMMMMTMMMMMMMKTPFDDINCKKIIIEDVEKIKWNLNQQLLSSV